MVTVVEVLLAEEHRSRVGTQDDVRPEPANGGHQLFPEAGVVEQFPVGIVQELLSGQPQHRCRLGRLRCSLSGEGGWINGRIGRTLVAIGAQQDVHLASGLGPAGQRPPTRHVGIVGMGVDPERPTGNFCHVVGHGHGFWLSGRSVLLARVVGGSTLALVVVTHDLPTGVLGRRGFGQEPYLPLKVICALKSLVDAGEP